MFTQSCLFCVAAGLRSPFPRTARPEVLALAVALFRVMVAGLLSSGFAYTAELLKS